MLKSPVFIFKRHLLNTVDGKDKQNDFIYFIAITNYTSAKSDTPMCLTSTGKWVCAWPPPKVFGIVFNQYPDQDLYHKAFGIGEKR